VPDPADFDFALPAARIAQQPPPARDGGRLMLLDRDSGAVGHSEVRALPGWLNPGDLLVVNATRVQAARLRGHKISGGAAEALLLERETAGRYRALLRHSGRLRAGLKYRLGAPALDAEVVDVDAGGIALLAFDPGVDPYASGEMPLPPYIGRPAPDPHDVERYQTRFARVPGSVAAPTAGLHLSDELLDALTARGVERTEIVLQVGLGTFRPPSDEDLARGELHAEAFEVPEAAAQAIARTRERGGRVVAVGTTVTRALESCAADDGSVRPGAGETKLLLAPGSRFRAIDALLTNFHLPRSSLLMLVAAFAGRERVMAAYRTAIAEGYRFYSYGDAMLIRTA
jgi:S-adenosylmethionine:tRNA ribosyltransferase-isomerase